MAWGRDVPWSQDERDCGIRDMGTGLEERDNVGNREGIDTVWLYVDG